MPVTSPSIPLLFCEGKPDSLDYIFLSYLAVGTVQICPGGGKYGLNAFVEGRLSSYGVNTPQYLVVRDRDFDAEPPASVQLIEYKGEKPIWLTYRACIENYLLDAELLHQYWTTSSVGPEWRHGSPPDVLKLDEKMDSVARDITAYQATRWALAKLKPGRRWPEIYTTWRKGSGYLPPSLDRVSCQSAGRKLVRCFAAETAMVTESKFDEQEEYFHTLFHSADFWEQNQYFVWFHGKDLFTALRRCLDFSRQEIKDYCTWATQHLDTSKHPDLGRLRQKIQEL